jgi:hypothetical protein
VHGVAVEQLGAPQALAVVVDRHRAVDDLVAAIAVDVGDAELVVALAAEPRCRARRCRTASAGSACRCGSPRPPGWCGRNSRGRRPGWAAGRPDRPCRPGSGRSGWRSRRPRSGHLLDRRGVGARIARGRVGRAGQGLAGRAVEHGEIFGALEDAALHLGDLRAVGQDRWRRSCRPGAARRRSRASRRSASPSTLPVPSDRAVAGAHGDLGLAVAVIVDRPGTGCSGRRPGCCGPGRCATGAGLPACRRR